eukprot:9202403-Karenia_brevis.AAC.1
MCGKALPTGLPLDDNNTGLPNDRGSSAVSFSDITSEAMCGKALPTGLPLDDNNTGGSNASNRNTQVINGNNVVAVDN